MPELPEVETIRRGLEPQLVGRAITGVRVRQPQLRGRVDTRALQREAVDRAITAVDRRAKYLLIRLHPDRVLIIHLGMTGRLSVGPPPSEDALHDHLIFDLGEDLELRYNDARRFGMCFITTDMQLSDHPRMHHLGPEPLSPEFTADYLHEQAKSSRRPIKNFLMDGTVVVGVGNIYASECLHLARIRPTREVGRLRPMHWTRICDAVQQVLQTAIEHRGTTLSDYVDSEGREGDFQNRLLVYGREGEACERDRRRIKRVVQAGRSSYYCPGCQR